jgi:alpha-tubulin suppressor-like RCC1 family protein
VAGCAAALLLAAAGCAKELTTVGTEPSARLTFVGISAAVFHSCGVVSKRAAYCWGLNSTAQLGNGDTTGISVSTPVAVSGGLGFVAVSAGDEYTCGLTAGGAAYCWGIDVNHTLGNGSMTGPQRCAINPIRGWYLPCSSIPVAVSGGLTFMTVSAGDQHACGVTTGGAAYCWGLSQFGELGDGMVVGLVPSITSSPRPVSGGLTFVTVSAGYGHTCGLTTDGAAYCWGWNAYGQLGDGVTTSSSTPVAVSGGLTFAAVSAGFDHTCAVTTANAAYCWGHNDYGGKLGNGDTTSSSTPVAVSGGLTFAAVSAGNEHTCGVTIAGAAYCWGENGYGGLLGNGDTTSSSTPVAVSGGLTFAAVSLGMYHTCGVTTASAAYCWGFNSYGELGNGSTANSRTPARVGP